MAEELKRLVLEGLSKLKMAAFLQIISTILLVAAIIPLLGAILTFNLGAVIAGGIIFGILLLVALIMMLIAVYAELLPSARSMAKWKPDEFSTASTLLRIGYIWGFILLILALILVVAAAVATALHLILTFNYSSTSIWGNRRYTATHRVYRLSLIHI